MDGQYLSTLQSSKSTSEMGRNSAGGFREALVKCLRNNVDRFAWLYMDLKGVPKHVCEHRIPLIPGMKPSRQSRYHMNALRVKEELDKLETSELIEKVEVADWLSPIVIVPKKDGRLRICIDYRMLNAATQNDPFPLPALLESVAGHDVYSFMDSFSGYNQVMITPEDKHACSCLINV